MELSDIVREVLAALSARDSERIAAYLHDDVVYECPYVPSIRSPRDHDGFIRLLTRICRNHRRFDIEITDLYKVEGREVVIAEFRSDAVIAATGARYRNQYVVIFRFSGDQITLWREFADPIAIEHARSQARAGAVPATEQQIPD